MSASVAIVGGGLAGLSAACALADCGFHITLFERRPFIGGRASSYEHPGTGEVVDNCQHVLLGCCTNLIDLYRRFGSENKIQWYDRLTFIEPGGRRSEIYPSILPAPFHSSPAFLEAASLNFADKLAISRAMLTLAGQLPADTNEDFLHWLKRHGQTQQAIDRFWKVVLVSAINEDLDRISVRYGAQVFRESFLKSEVGGQIGIPRVPLTELYNAGADYIRHRSGEVKLRTAVERIESSANSVTINTSSGPSRSDYAVMTVPYYALSQLLPEDMIGAELARRAANFESSPITGIHLWFDREFTKLDHAVLLDRTIQWMFHKSRLLARFSQNGQSNPSYIELVVSASKSLVEKQRQEIIDLGVKELSEFFPAVKEAKLLKATVIKEVHATYSAKPGSDAYRPAAITGWPRVFLAGDWTATGWPATMEGAVRSGYLAAEALSASAGKQRKFLVPDLPASGFMRLFA